MDSFIAEGIGLISMDSFIAEGIGLFLWTHFCIIAQSSY